MPRTQEEIDAERGKFSFLCGLILLPRQTHQAHKSRLCVSISFLAFRLMTPAQIAEFKKHKRMELLKRKRLKKQKLAEQER